ncbi:hypothetical protein GW17_00055320 [Ensete ventricosum]|nr:hypothetical protein GW17_00055320 [Ensete ventricosum]
MLVQMQRNHISSRTGGETITAKGKSESERCGEGEVERPRAELSGPFLEARRIRNREGVQRGRSPYPGELCGAREGKPRRRRRLHERKKNGHRFSNRPLLTQQTAN